MLVPNIETEVKKILKEKGKGGWLRVHECAKYYRIDPETGKVNKSRETNFYRWRKQVEKGKVEGFQVLPFPNNIVFIGLKSADPRGIKTVMLEDKKISRSIKNGFGFWEYLKWRKLHAEQKRDRQLRELEAERDALIEIVELTEDEYTPEKEWQIRDKWRKRYGLKD
jgi:hypothetical protein